MSDELDFSVLLDDFTKDAAKWRDIGTVVGTSRAAAAAVETVPPLVTDGISYAAGFKEQYDQLASWTVDYLSSAGTALEEIATSLEDTRREYLDSEEYAVWKSTHG